MVEKTPEISQIIMFTFFCCFVSSYFSSVSLKSVDHWNCSCLSYTFLCLSLKFVKFKWFWPPVLPFTKCRRHSCAQTLFSCLIDKEMLSNTGAAHPSLHLVPSPYDYCWAINWQTIYSKPPSGHKHMTPVTRCTNESVMRKLMVNS